MQARVPSWLSSWLYWWSLIPTSLSSITYSVWSLLLLSALREYTRWGWYKMCSPVHVFALCAICACAITHMCAWSGGLSNQFCPSVCQSVCQPKKYWGIFQAGYRRLLQTFVVNAIVLGCFCTSEYILVGNGIEILQYNITAVWLCSFAAWTR